MAASPDRHRRLNLQQRSRLAGEAAAAAAEVETALSTPSDPRAAAFSQAGGQQPGHSSPG